MHTSSSDLDAFLLALPKAELHVHLEGSIQPKTLLTLARRYGIDIGCSSAADGETLYHYRDFRHFLELFALSRSVLRRPEDFALTIEELRQSPEKGMHLKADAPELAPTLWRKVEGFPNHLIFFQVDGGKLLVMRVVHGSRNWTQFL